MLKFKYLTTFFILTKSKKTFNKYLLNVFLYNNFSVMKYNSIFLLSFLSILLINCSKDTTNNQENEEEEEAEKLTIEIPTSSVNYEEMSNWAYHPEKVSLLTNYNLDISVINKDLEIESEIAITNNAFTNTGVDVFFVHPTVLTQNSTPENINIEDQQDFLISATILAQGGLLSKYGRMYAPRYRQSTGLTYKNETDKELQANVIATSYSDIKASFLNYLENDNNGNKIILASHSQGSYLVAMLLRDLFDNDPELQSKLVTAALAGMGYIYAPENTYKGGWWQNISFCQTTSECGCIQSWASFDEEQTIPEVNYGLPEFNEYLINSGLVYKEFEETKDWFVQDNSYYAETFQSLRYYITPDASYDLTDANFIAFDNLYNARFKRDGAHKAVLSVTHTPEVDDNRPNELAEEQNHPNYNNWGYHTKDYHIYLWALMEQIDAKLTNCN